ncbi:MAG: hypothetical protein KDK62_07590 [Chlamydiia bacterium]|nr:hypothetical protein [Chlamydiia bacterium]
MSKLEIIKEETPNQNTIDNPVVSYWIESGMDWVKENRQKVLWGVFFFFLLLFLFFRLFSGGQAKAQQDFIEAKEISNTVLLSDHTQADLKKLKPLLARRPELHQEFDGIMAQAFLNLDDVQSSKKYFAKVESRLDEPEAKSALLNGKIALETPNNPKAAYQEALKLKAELTDETSPLYTYNLVHIWFLEKTLGMSQEEKKSLENLIALYKKGGASARVMQSISGDGPAFFAYLNEQLLNQ